MEEQYWSNFESSGKIEDYLKYKGIQNIDGIFDGGINEVTKSEGGSNQRNSI